MYVFCVGKEQFKHVNDPSLHSGPVFFLSLFIGEKKGKKEGKTHIRSSPHSDPASLSFSQQRNHRPQNEKKRGNNRKKPTPATEQMHNTLNVHHNTLPKRPCDAEIDS